MPKMVSLDQMMADYELRLVSEENAGSGEMEGPEAAVLLGLWSVPDEAYRARREEQKAVRDRWS